MQLSLCWKKWPAFVFVLSFYFAITHAITIFQPTACLAVETFTYSQLTTVYGNDEVNRRIQEFSLDSWLADQPEIHHRIDLETKILPNANFQQLLAQAGATTNHYLPWLTFDELDQFRTMVANSVCRSFGLDSGSFQPSIKFEPIRKYLGDLSFMELTPTVRLHGHLMNDLNVKMQEVRPGSSLFNIPLQFYGDQSYCSSELDQALIYLSQDEVNRNSRSKLADLVSSMGDHESVEKWSLLKKMVCNPYFRIIHNLEPTRQEVRRANTDHLFSRLATTIWSNFETMLQEYSAIHSLRCSGDARVYYQQFLKSSTHLSHLCSLHKNECEAARQLEELELKRRELELGPGMSGFRARSGDQDLISNDGDFLKKEKMRDSN